MTAAISRNSDDAVAYDARARIWRDWQMPERAFEDARRALQLAPRSAEVHNTMGTIFFALEQPGEARREFTTAISIDPAAAYAANNLCYLAFLSGDTADAEAQCQRAIALVDPQGRRDVGAAIEVVDVKRLDLLDAASRESELTDYCGALGEAGIRVSLFIDPDPLQVESSLAIGVPVVEIHTGGYAEARDPSTRAIELDRIHQAVALGTGLGLQVNAGHGLDYHNVRAIAAIPGILELLSLIHI